MLTSSRRRILSILDTTGIGLAAFSVLLGFFAAFTGLVILAWPVIILLLVGLGMVMSSLIDRSFFRQPNPNDDPEPVHQWGFQGEDSRCIRCGQLDRRLLCSIKGHPANCQFPECRNYPCPDATVW
jgi:hypothetical protein